VNRQRTGTRPAVDRHSDPLQKQTGKQGRGRPDATATRRWCARAVATYRSLEREGAVFELEVRHRRFFPVRRTSTWKGESAVKDARQRVASYPLNWKPEAGDVLYGRVIELEERTSTQDMSLYPLVTVETEEGDEYQFRAWHKAAKEQLARLQPKPGEMIAIKYHGESPDGGAKRYRIAVERDGDEGGTAPNWAAMQSNGGGEPAAAEEPSSGNLGEEEDGIPF